MTARRISALTRRAFAALLTAALVPIITAPASAEAAPVVAAPGAQAQAQAPATPPAAMREVAAFHRFFAGDADNSGTPTPEDLERERVVSHWVSDPDGDADVRLGAGNKEYGGLVHISPATNRIYQFYSLEKVGDPDAFRVGLFVRNLENPEEIVSAFVFPHANPAGFTALTEIVESTAHNRGELPYAVDAAKKRMYFFLDRGTVLNRRVLTIDETKLPDGARGTTPAGAFTIRQLSGTQVATDYATALLGFVGGGPLTLPPLPDPRWAHMVGTVFRGMTFSHGRLYVILGHPSPTGDEQAAGRYRLLQVHPDDFTIEWDRVVRGCEAVWHPNMEPKSAISGWGKIFRTDDAIYVPCHAAGSATVVRIPLSSAADPAGAEQVFRGNGSATGYAIDEQAGRIHIKIKTQIFDAVLTFDTRHHAFVGQQAATTSESIDATVVGLGVDKQTGRIYVQTVDDEEAAEEPENDLGLALMNGREAPVQPPTAHREFASEVGSTDDRWRVLPTDPERWRLYLPEADKWSKQDVRVIAVPPPAPIPPKPDPDANTIDVDEGEFTDVSASSTAGGYGLRHLLVGGPVGFLPARLLDNQQLSTARVDWPACHDADREFAFGQVINSRLTSSLQSANSIALGADEGTLIDVRQPSRCTARPELPDPTHEGLVDTAEDAVCKGATPGNPGGIAPWAPAIYQQVLDTIINQIVGEEPEEPDDDEAEDPRPDSFCTVTREGVDRMAGREWPFEAAACTSEHLEHATRPEGSAENPENHALTGFRASVDCAEPGVVEAAALAEPANTANLLPATPPGLAGLVPSISVGAASNSVSQRRDPEAGIVARSESILRDLTITLPSGQGVITIGGAYSLAETRAKGRPGSAQTTYQRALWGVNAVGVGGTFTQQIAATEQQMKDLAAGLNRVLGDRGEIRIPPVDAALATGTPKGYQAAIQLDEFDSINRQVVNGDGLKEVPALEIVFFNESRHYGRQRQIFQLAGVLANSQYGIFCTGGAQASGSECVKEPVPPGSINISLEDDNGDPLAGGAFTASGNGSGSCTTSDEGTCSIAGVAPGSYRIDQTKAPGDYTPGPDVSVSVPPGGVATARFVNLRGIGTINISLLDASNGEPLAGGAFAVAGEKVTATCVTDSSGICVLNQGRTKSNEVPLGNYTVQQSAAPRGYEPVPDVVEVELEAPGQSADLEFTNGVVGGAVAGKVVPFEPAGSSPSASGSPFDSLADLFNWLRRNLGEALLFAASLVMFGTPFYASYRRRLLIEAENPPIFPTR